MFTLFGNIRKLRGKETKKQVGKAVRISKCKNTFGSGFTQNWTDEIFYVQAVDRRMRPVMYVLRDYHNKVLEGKFYSEELQKVNVPEHWVIEKVVRRRAGKSLVKFLGDPALYWVDAIVPINKTHANRR